jgi:hypothetical protein
LDRKPLDDDDATGSIAENPSLILPVDIGEASSTELPLSAAPEMPPVIVMPQQVKPARQSARQPAHRAQAAPAKPAAPIDFFGQLFNAGKKEPAAAHTAPQS